MKRPLFFTLLVVIIAAISVFLVYNLVPEERSVGSTDGVLVVSGLTRTTQPYQITIKEIPDLNKSILRGSIYQVEPSSIVLDNPAVLRFNLTGFETPSSLVVYKYDADFSMWEKIERVVELKETSIAVEVDQLGTYALGLDQTIEAPSFFSTIDELIGMAPPDAVGFEIAVGYAVSDDFFIRLNDQTQVGGCGGIVTKGKDVAQSQTQRQTKVLINDVLRETTFNFIATWFVTGENGCDEEKNLEVTPNL